MLKSHFLSSTFILLTAGVAFAAQACPDKAVEQEVLAPVVQTAELSVPSSLSQPVSSSSSPITTPAATIEQPKADYVAPEPARVEQPARIEQSAQAQSYGSGNNNTAKAVSPAAAYEALLMRRISKGAAGLNLFDYAGTKSSGDDKIIRDYIAFLSKQNPDAMPPAVAVAYWANLYNAETLRLIIDNYPLKSIRKIGGLLGPWKKNTLVVNGKDTSLDHIEHGILRKQYPSPYIHYMVNCASIGCPNLSNRLWRAETLEADQIAAANDYINSPRGVAIRGNKLELSSIFKWFKEDFGGTAGVLPHIRKHARPELAAAIDNGARIGGYEYDWSLNE